MFHLGSELTLMTKQHMGIIGLDAAATLRALVLDHEALALVVPPPPPPLSSECGTYKTVKARLWPFKTVKARL